MFGGRNSETASVSGGGDGGGGQAGGGWVGGWVEEDQPLPISTIAGSASPWQTFLRKVSDKESSGALKTLVSIFRNWIFLRKLPHEF